MNLTIFSYDPAAQGSAYIAALEAAGVTCTLTAAGLLVSDAALAASIAADAAAILAQAQTIAAANVTLMLAGKIAAGWTYDGALYQIDAGAQANIAAMGALAGAVQSNVPGASWPTGFAWIDAANGSHAMNAAQMFVFAQGAATYVSALILNARALKDAILAATTVNAVQAIDLTAGWPS